MEFSTVNQPDVLEVIMHLKKNTQTHENLLVEDTDKNTALDWEALISLAVNGGLEVFLLGDDGYAVFMTGKNMLYRHINEATNIVLFVDEGSRTSTDKFLQYCEDELKSKGFDEVNYLLRSEKLGRYLGIKGYKNDYKVWSKKL